MLKMCPICGYDLIKSDNIIIGLYVLLPNGHIYYKGELLPFTKQEAQFLYTLARANGTPVSRDLILERISEVEYSDSLVKVVFRNIQQKFIKLNIDIPIKNIHGNGIAWIKD